MTNTRTNATQASPIPSFAEISAAHLAGGQAEIKEMYGPIICGQAVVPWSKATRVRTPDPQFFQAGWVLPGGQRTASYTTALEAAQRIAKIIQDNSGYARPA